MGEILSTPSHPSPPNSGAAAPAAEDSSHAVTKSPESENPAPEASSDHPVDRIAETEKLEENSPEIEKVGEDDSTGEGDAGEEEEEEGECGFCLFMKGGGCRETFIEWEKCVEEGEKNKEDIVEKCFGATDALKKCMEAHSDYYGPLLQAEKDAEAEVAKQMEEAKNDAVGKKETHNADVSEGKAS